MYRRRQAQAREGIRSAAHVAPRPWWHAPGAPDGSSSSLRNLAAVALALLAASFSVAAVPAAADQVRAATRGTALTRPPASATLEACQSSPVQAERAATFVGEMTSVPGTARMLMRIDVLERSGSQSAFRTVTYPGLGAWLHAVSGVKTYKNLDRVTDLAAPAEYRAAIRFHWLNAHGRLLRSALLRTPICTEPTVEPQAPAPGPAA